MLEFFYGSLTASLMLVLAERVPKHLPLSGRSVCDGCAAPLTLLDVTPVLGWVRARGRARCCGVALSPAHLLVEVVAGLWCTWALATPSALTGVLAVAGIGLVFTRGYHRTMTGPSCPGPRAPGMTPLCLWAS